MHHAVLVRVRERRGDAAADAHDLADLERRPVLLALAQRLPLDERHDVVEPALRLARVEHGNDAGVAQQRGGANLAGETLRPYRLGDVRTQHLERHRAMGVLAVAGEIDRAHAAACDHALDVIALSHRPAQLVERGGLAIRRLRHLGLLPRRVTATLQRSRPRAGLRLARHHSGSRSARNDWNGDCSPVPSRGWEPNRRNVRSAALALLLCTSLAGFVRADSAPSQPPIELKLPADIVYTHGLSADSAVVFRHATHVEIAGRVCTGCHPRPFSMLSPKHRESHVAMNAGGSCGGCHDGRKAFGVRDASSCRTCHSGRRADRVAAAGKGSPAPGGGPPPIAYARSAGSPGKVTFRHPSHLRGTSCATCHPAPFRMRALSTAPSAMHESGACGKCHDGKHAFGAQDPEKCARCHVEGKAP